MHVVCFNRSAAFPLRERPAGAKRDSLSSRFRCLEGSSPGYRNSIRMSWAMMTRVNIDSG